MNEERIDISENPEIVEAIIIYKNECSRIQEEASKLKNQMQVLEKRMQSYLEEIKLRQNKLWEIVYIYFPYVENTDATISDNRKYIICKEKSENDTLDSLLFKLFKEFIE